MKEATVDGEGAIALMRWRVHVSGLLWGRRVLGQFGEHDRRAVGKFRNDANVATHCFDRFS